MNIEALPLPTSQVDILAALTLERVDSDPTAILVQVRDAETPHSKAALIEAAVAQVRSGLDQHGEVGDVVTLGRLAALSQGAGLPAEPLNAFLDEIAARIGSVVTTQAGSEGRRRTLVLGYGQLLLISAGCPAEPLRSELRAALISVARGAGSTARPDEVPAAS